MDLESLDLERPILSPPFRDPPPADADDEERAAWSELYVMWFIGETGGLGRTPPDVRPSHRYEVEFNACVLDPQAYVRDIREELRA